MANYNAGDFRKGIKVTVEGVPYEMIHCDFVKPGKGQALYRSKLRNLLTGSVLERTYRSGDSLDGADIHNSDGLYSYFDGTYFVFMDNTSFEQVQLSGEICGQVMKYIKEGTPVQLMYWNDKLIDVTPPKHIVLEILSTEPSPRGNTATNVSKPAVVEGGVEIKVPAFISAGEKVKIDTETGEYLGRVN